jgi:glycosyltransferase involved in cell wall biosynthesis
MKILMVLESEFPPDVRVENEALSLIDFGHEVHVACYTRMNRKKFEEIDKLIIHRKSINNLIYKSSVACLKLPFYFNFWRKYLTRLLTEYTFDTIHIHDLPLGTVGYELKKKFNVPLIMDSHENWPALLEKAVHTNTFLGKILSSNKQWRKYEKNILMKADKIITVVEEMKERLIRFGIDKKKIFIVSNTLKISSFPLPVKDPNPDYFTLFYAGGLNYHRGLQIVIKALKIIIPKNSNIRLWIVGKGSYRKKLEKLISSLNLEDHIKFWGWKNINEIADLLMQSDIALIPHLKYEHTDSTIPHKLFQYLYAGKPIIASDCKPIKRILEETNTGIVYESTNSEQLAKKIIELTLDKEKYNSLTKSGKKWIEEKYKWRNSSEVLIGMYNEISDHLINKV